MTPDDAITRHHCWDLPRFSYFGFFLAKCGNRFWYLLMVCAEYGLMIFMIWKPWNTAKIKFHKIHFKKKFKIYSPREQKKNWQELTGANKENAKTDAKFSANNMATDGDMTLLQQHHAVAIFVRIGSNRFQFVPHSLDVTVSELLFRWKYLYFLYIFCI